VKFKVPVSINVLSPFSFRRADEFLNAVRTFCESLPEVSPEKWGWWEPLKRDFDCQDLKQLVHENGNCGDVFWKRGKRPKARGSFFVRWRSKSPQVRDTHAWINLTTELGQVGQDSLVAYLKRASVRTEADFALLDALSASYGDFAIESQSARYSKEFTVMTHLLRHWLPDIFWGTVFGPAYVRLFGKERLLTAPAYVVEELGPEMVYVQLTERIDDAVNDYEKLQLSRQLFKDHLHSNAFFKTGQGYDRSQKGPVGDMFTVPTFELREE